MSNDKLKTAGKLTTIPVRVAAALAFVGGAVKVAMGVNKNVEPLIRPVRGATGHVANLRDNTADFLKAGQDNTPSIVTGGVAAVLAAATYWVARRAAQAHKFAKRVEEDKQKANDRADSIGR